MARSNTFIRKADYMKALQVLHVGSVPHSATLRVEEPISTQQSMA